MPGMTGLELVEKLRQNPSVEKTPVIMLTARSVAFEEGQAESLEISEFLSKPFSPKELLKCVEEILYHRAVTQKV